MQFVLMKKSSHAPKVPMPQTAYILLKGNSNYSMLSKLAFSTFEAES